MQSTVIDQLSGKNIGDYQITRSLGSGTLSAVYEARKENAATTFAVTTFLLPDTLSVPARMSFMKRFEREGSIVSALRHSYILPVLDYGEHDGIPYLVTPSVKGSSLKKLLRHKGSFTPQQVFELLKRVVDGFGYAHQHGVVHGTLNSSNILFSDSMQIAGFGLMAILTVQGIEKNTTSSLLSIAGTMLGTPGYIAPELIQGKPVDARADVYALGILLMEMLNGSFPFDETKLSPSRFVPAPRLATLRPDLPPQFDAVIQQAVNPDPQQRISSVSELLALFEKACSVASTQTAISKQKTIHDRETTLPSTVNWDKEENLFATGKWKGASPVEVRPEEKGSSQKRPRVESPAAKSAYDAVQEQDPFVWWSNMSAKQAAVQPTPSTPTKTAPRMTAAKKRSEHKPGRRRAVAMIAGGSVVALGALGFGGVTLAHRLQNKPVATTGTPKQSSMTMTQPTKTTTKAQPTKAANSNPPKGTTQPAPPKHTGTVVGSTTLGVNTAKTFTNPKDGTGSLLIHLPNGNFVAYNSACTHVGVTVHYDPATQKLVCPAHGSIFDPANMATPLKGPAMTPLQTVPIHVNGDGTITVG
jgi:serine/threonine-protein kinase